MPAIAMAFTILFSAMPALAQSGYGGGPGWDHPMMGWAGPFMGILMFAAFVAVIVIAILVVRYLWTLGHGYSAGRGNREALELLDQRYAKGEIDREEYLRRKEDLRA